MPTGQGRAAIRIDPERCTGCGSCVTVCRAGCLDFAPALNARGDLPVLYTGAGCLGDGACLRACPEPGALDLVIERRPSRPSAPATAWAPEPA